jgi:hypothetical protein
MDWGSSERIDLRVQGLRDAGLFTSRDPVDRARNYELGNVLAKAYGRDALPSDEALRDDLLRAVSTLLALHDVSLEDSAAPESAPRIPRRGLGRLSGPERRAVEARSMEVTREYYKAGGWTVEDVSAFRPYDYECTKDGLALHVEVKGSTASDIRQIELTRNEVDHCRSYPAMGLALVSGIRLETGGSGLPVGEGGVLSFVIPWSIEDARLTPLAFAYELPATRVTEELSRTSG